MLITKNNTVSEIVTKDYRTAQVFKKHKIDFCCNGDRTIESISNETSIKAQELIREIEAISIQASSTADYNLWPLHLLADHIEEKHHRYAAQKIGEIIPYLEKIIHVHGDRHSELLEIKNLFEESAGDLTMHMKKEELVLFPFIREIAKASENSLNTIPRKPAFGSIRNPIAIMVNDHKNEGDRFRKIAALSNNYITPEDGCNTYRVTLGMLKEFEDDLHLHIHLENNILFPKAIAIEATLV